MQWFSVEYQASSWARAYRVVIKSTRSAGEILFRHEFLITNLKELSSKQIFPMYQNRGAMENLIKEIKSGFFFDKTDSSSFQVSTFRMLLSSIAYNLIQLMKQLVFPETKKPKTIATIRFCLFRIAAKFVHHARKSQIQLSSSHVFEKIFWQIVDNINRLKLFSFKR
ncbi:transposase [Vagococcus fluvialis]|uniref:transposase n=1 Tax=Vagococcus fluvialis TaxID=2738 RepID=UPI003D11DF00